MNWILSHFRQLGADFLLPDLNIVALDREHSHWLGVVVQPEEHALHHGDEVLGAEVVLLLVEDAPLLDGLCLKHLEVHQADANVLCPPRRY